MGNSSNLLSELCSLEDKMYKIVTALTEAMVRQAAVQRRGPLITPNPDWWETYIQDLQTEFTHCNKRLEAHLYSINWRGSRLPSSLALWPEWWSAVRRHARSISLQSQAAQEIVTVG